MKGSKRDSQKFRWKFTKSMLRRPLEKSPSMVMVHQEKWHWHGTILAILTIALISGVIVLAALFFTSWGSKIHYQRFTVGELSWASRRYKDPAYFWHKDILIVANPNGSWYQMNLSGTIPASFAESLTSAHTISLNTKEFEPVSGLWPNSEQSAWLIEHQGTSIRTQEKCLRYTVILLKSGLRIEVKLTEGHRTEEQLHFARWTDQAEFSLLVQTGSHLYFTRSIVDGSSSEFQCLTCRLPKGWTYAYPGWIYRYYFGYGQVGVFWKSGTSDILVLATNEDHLKTLPVVRYQTSVGDFSTDVEAAVHTPYRPLSKPLRVPRVKIILMDFSGNLKISFNWTTLSTLVAQIPNESNTLNETNNFVLTHVEWFNETNFLLFGVFDTERCGFVLLCSVLQEQKERRCQHVWYQCVWKGSLNMQRSPGELSGSSNGIDQFITKLPYITATEDTTYQIAILRIVPGERNQVTWLTTHPIQVNDLLHIGNTSIYFTGTVQPATRHLYRLDLLPNGTVWCLTCVELNSRLTSLLPVNDLKIMRIVPSEKINLTGGLLRSVARNATFRTITRFGLSTSGVCFTLQWDTGNVIFGASGVKEAPTRMVINQLTRIGHEASEYDDSRFEASARFDPDSGVSLWCQMANNNVTMVWHSHLLLSDHIRQLHHKTTNVDHLQKSSTRSRIVRSTLTDRSPVTSPKSAKQHQTLPPGHNMKDKSKLVGASQSPLHMLYPTPPFGDRPLPNVVLRLINLTTDKVQMIDFSGNLMWNPPLASDGVEDGVLVRFWFPPYLNERHLQVYPLLINVVSVNGMQAPGQERLLDELAVFLSASLNVITMRVQNWIGRALIRALHEGIDGEIFNYRLLLQSLKDHYYYIRWDNIGLVGAHGIHAHLAGLLLREEWMPLNLTCAALLSPVVSWALQGFQDAARVFDPRDEYKHLEYDLTKWTHLYRNKDIFLIYGTADTIVPYQSTAKFVSALAEKGVQYSMLPLFDADHEYAERQDLKESLLTRLSVFLCDCLRSKDTARANLYRRLHMEGPA